MTAGNLQGRPMHERSLELAAAAIDFDLSAAEVSELEAHLAGCSTCARRAAAMRSDAVLLGRPISVLPSSRVDDAVYLAIAGQHRRPTRVPMLVAAALLLLALLGAVAVGSYLLRTWQALPISVVPLPSASDAETSPRPDGSPVLSAPEVAAPSPNTGTTGVSPRVVIWSLPAANRIAVSTFRSGANGLSPLFELDTWPDPDLAAGSAIDRQVLASPTGQVVAVRETDPSGKARIRVVTSKGSVVWSTEGADGVPAMAWSADGSSLALAYVARPWLIVGFAPDGTAKTRDLPLTTRSVPLQTTVALRLVGFSADGQTLLAYDAAGQAAPWERPYSVDLNGEVTPIERFQGGPTSIAVSNTTSPAGLVDPVTGRVLDGGDRTGNATTWSFRAGGTSVALDVPLTSSAATFQAIWADDGAIVILQTSLDSAPPSNDQLGSALGVIRSPTASAQPPHYLPVTWSYSGPFGTRSRGVLLGVRDGWALVGQYAVPSKDAAWLGFDQVSLTHLSSGRFALMDIGGLGKRDVHVAGLISTR